MLTDEFTVNCLNYAKVATMTIGKLLHPLTYFLWFH